MFWVESYESGNLMTLPKNSTELIKAIATYDIISALVQQLNKDFKLCNLKISYKTDLLPLELYKKLSRDIWVLFTMQYDDYLNLMYRIDISEAELLQIKNSNSDQISDQISFLILKRVYQKVWLKRNFDKL